MSALRLTHAIFALLVLPAALSCGATAADEVCAKVSGGTLQVFQDPDGASTKLFKLQPGATIAVHQTDEEWSMIAYVDYKKDATAPWWGWVPSRNLVAGKCSAKLTATFKQ